MKGGRSLSRGQKNGNESLISDLRSIAGSRTNSNNNRLFGAKIETASNGSRGKHG